MAKLASQLVPLKTQLASSIAMLRFADTSEMNTNTTLLSALGVPQLPTQGAVWEERVYDASGTSNPTGTPNVGAVISALSGPPTLNAPTASLTGGTLTQPCTIYTLMPLDSSNRGGRMVSYVAFFNNGSNGNSVTMNVNTSGLTGATKFRLWKFVITPSGTPASYEYTTSIVPGSSTWTITDAYPNLSTQSPTISSGTWTANSMGTPALDLAINPATTAVGTMTMSGISSSAGGAISSNYSTGHQIPVAVVAYNILGATVASPTQYVSLGINELISMGTIGTATSTASGALTAGTYYYKVTGISSYGESLASTEVSATLSAAGTINLSWTAVPGALSYGIYRGAASNGEILIATTASTSYADAGTASPSSNIPVPSVGGSGPVTTCSISFSWSAVSGAVGYRLLGGAGVSFQTFPYYGMPTTSSTSQAMTGSETLTQGVYAPSVSWTGDKVTRVGKLMQFDAQSVIGRVGLTFQPVAGKLYRSWCYIGNTLFYSAYVTAPSSSLQYMEFPPIATWGTTNSLASGSNYMVGVEGSDATSTIGIAPAIWPVSSDVYGQLNSNVATYMASGGNIGGASNSSSTVTWGSGYQSTYLSPILGSVDLPIKIVRRIQNSATALSANGTLTGLASASTQYFISNNLTTTSAVKSIVPTWSAASGAFSGFGGQTYQGVEVSTDGGTTWASLTNSTRFTFTTATTQMMFRFTIAGMGASVYASLLPGIGNSITNGSYSLSNNGTSVNTGVMGTTDSGVQTVYYNSGRNGNSQDGMTTTGVWLGQGQGAATYRSSIVIQGSGVNDADVSVNVDNSVGTGHAGPLVRSTDGTYSNGYYLAYSNTGALNLYALVAQATGTLPTALATASTGLGAGRRNVRLVANGSHLMGFVDGKQYIDVTDTTIIAGTNHGLAGAYARVAGLSVNAPTGMFPVNALEQFSAYLEY